MKALLMATAAAAITLLAGHAAAAYAQELADQSLPQLQDIFITAERRSTDLQKSALAVTVLTGADIEQRAAAEEAQVLQNVPSLIIQGADGFGTTGGPPTIAIRGLGTDGPNKSPSTAVYEDGVIVVGGGANYYDLSRVEVVRGPQGTLYGRDATGGAVNIITNDPVQQDEANGTLQYGSYGLVRTQGMFNMPLSDSWAGRIAFNQIRHDGYFGNGQSDENEVNTRLKLLYQPGEDFSLLLGGVYWKTDSAGPGQVLLSAADNYQARDWTTTIPEGGLNHVYLLKEYANLNWNLGFTELTYIPAVQTLKANGSQYGGPGDQLTSAPLDRTLTQELRLSNPAGSRLTWVGGIYYYDYDNANTYVGEPGPPYSLATSYSIDQVLAQSSIAAFGEATLPITATLRATAGIRANEDRIHNVETDDFHNITGAAPTSTVLGRNFSHIDWKARLENDFAAGGLGYAMVSTGYRPGGESQNGSYYGDEWVSAYELGLKNRFGRKLQLNTSVYYYDYSGFQTPESFTIPGTSVIAGDQTVVLPARFYGAEAELTWLFSPQDRLTLSPSYEEARYRSDFVITNPLEATCSAAVTAGCFAATVIPTNGGTPPHTPRWTLSGDYQHTFRIASGGNIVAQTDAHYQTQQFDSFDTSIYGAGTTWPGPIPDPNFVQKAYTIWDATLAYDSPGGRYTVTLYGRNLGNAIYKLLTNPGGTGGYTALVNDPRTFGVMISASL